MTDARSSSDPERTDGEPVATRIDRIAREASRARESFEAPADPDERSREYLESGLWPVIECYIDVVRAGDRLDPDRHNALEEALNTWLALYARCYGVETDPDFSVREAAELFVDTHNIRDTAQLLTRVPDPAAARRADRE